MGGVIRPVVVVDSFSLSAFQRIIREMMGSCVTLLCTILVVTGGGDGNWSEKSSSRGSKGEEAIASIRKYIVGGSCVTYKEIV